MSARVRSQQGFALIEMLAAIVIINIGLLAILLALNSGMITLRRSGLIKVMNGETTLEEVARETVH